MSTFSRRSLFFARVALGLPLYLLVQTAPMLGLSSCRFRRALRPKMLVERGRQQTHLSSATGITVGDYFITSSVSSSNTPGTSLVAFVSTANLIITRLTDNFAGDLFIRFIRVLADDFTMPQGNPLYMKSEIGSSDVTVDAPLIRVDVQSFFSPTNSTLFGNGISTAMLTQFNGVGDEKSFRTVDPSPLFALSHIFRVNISEVNNSVTFGATTQIMPPFGFPTSKKESCRNRRASRCSQSVELVCSGSVTVGLGISRRRRAESVRD